MRLLMSPVITGLMLLLLSPVRSGLRSWIYENLVFYLLLLSPVLPQAFIAESCCLLWPHAFITESCRWPQGIITESHCGLRHYLPSPVVTSGIYHSESGRPQAYIYESR